MSVSGRAWMVMVLLPLCAAGRNEPPLPDWRAGDRALLESGTLVPGLVLLGEATIDAETGEATDSVAAVAVPAPEPSEEAAVVEELRNEIPEEFLAAYFESKPEGLLVDPQQLLSRQEYRDRLEFLRYHAEDSSIDLVIYLFDEGQEIPGEVRAEELVERYFAGDRPAAVVFYFLGAPQRARMWLSPKLAGEVPSPEQRRALKSSVNEALEKSDPVGQLEGFAVQTSIRLYWMERAQTVEESGAEGPLVVFAEPEEAAEPDAMARLDELVGSVRPWMNLVLGVLGGIVVLGLVMLLARMRMRYRFPQFDVPRRLGGEHGAGIGAVLSFGSTGLPPSAQRRRMPDYMQPL